MRTALVTGGNRGIGLAVATQLDQLGLRVIVGARDGAAAANAASLISAQAIGVSLEVTDAASVERARDAVGPIDILVNNAAVLQDDDTPVTEVDPDSITEHVAVNVSGALRVTQAFLVPMVAAGWGRVVMMSSENGRLDRLQPKAPAYSTSKAALNAVTVLLAQAVQHSGVLVNAVSPGRVRTRMLPSGERTPEEAARGVVKVATLPDGSLSGEFFREGAPLGWK